MLKYLVFILVVMFSHIKGQENFHDIRTHKNGKIKSVVFSQKVSMEGNIVMVPFKKEEYYDTGQLSMVENYTNFYPFTDVVLETKYWKTTGKKGYRINYKDGKKDGLYTSWYENGQKSEEGNYMNNDREGIWTTWYENGQKESEGTYKFGEMKLELWTFWYDNGQVTSTSTDRKVKEDGSTTHTTWYRNGKKQSEETYKDGKIISEKEWNEDGSVME